MAQLAGDDAAESDSDPVGRGNSAPGPQCCPLYHRAVELIGRRWTGAILEILTQADSLRFSQIASSVTDLSDRMLSDRLKELESYGLIERTVYPGPPVRVEYALTHKGKQLTPALNELKRWARYWLVDAAGGGSAPFAAAGGSRRTEPAAQPPRATTTT